MSFWAARFRGVNRQILLEKKNKNVTEYSPMVMAYHAGCGLNVAFTRGTYK